MKLQKFENVDVIASLEAIMKQNTAFYQSDFDIDKQILQKAAVSPVPEDKRLLWFSRPSGTCCFRERDVFLKDTRQHNTWRFYGEQTRDTILAYAVELTGTEQEKIKGNLYELDYLQHFREVIEKSIPADNYTLIYEHGELTKPAGQYFDGNTDPQLGKFIRFEAQPNDPEALKSILREQQKKRTPHTQGDFQLHIAALHDRRIEAEARRIVENVKGLGEPDSPEKTHCAVELSPYFVPLATDKDMERLLSMLPYKSLSFSTLEGRHGGELKSKIVYFLLDFFGLSYLFGTPTLNPTWWYISLALLIILAVPWILKLFRKAGILTTICLSMGLLFLLNASNANTFYLFPVLLGAGCQEGRVFERLDEFCKKKRWGKAIKIISETVLLLFMISIRTNYNYFGIPDGIIAFLLAVLTVDVLIKIPFLSRGMCFLGKHSGNMFLIHNQIYSYYFVGLIYGCGNWIACFVMLVGVSLVVSIGMEKIKEWTQYNRWMERIGQKTGKTIFYI